ncbi:formyltetrahydrofolate deformylase [Nocardioides sp.]|uniref:formyltetrahydrofolate deformylase n=1 Tax=Nocardioides sp. TaxID=35761 RepID=UPI003528D9A9
MTHHILTLQCPDRPGIVAALARGIGRADGNILDSAQFSDPGTGLFCVRTELESPLDDTARLLELIGEELTAYSPELTLRPKDHRRRALLMVSKIDHCLVDLLYRWDRGELPVDIPVVVSNHEDLRAIVEYYGIPFVHVPVTAETKPEAEARLFELVEEHQVDVVVLARYMQVLSDDACRRLAGRAINIHHSFLPGFKGAKPYHQAHDRGVKLIGATAHYVTADLDEGPIIEQDVVRVSHTRTAPEMVRLGRDVERLVLSRAVAAHAEDRVFLCGTRTVVFAE